MGSDAVEPPIWSFVIANLHDCSDRTVWEHDRDAWFCLCCDGRAQWEHLVDPVDTVCPEGYVNGAWNLISGETWPLATDCS